MLPDRYIFQFKVAASQALIIVIVRIIEYHWALSRTIEFQSTDTYSALPRIWGIRRDSNLYLKRIMELYPAILLNRTETARALIISYPYNPTNTANYSLLNNLINLILFVALKDKK